MAGTASIAWINNLDPDATAFLTVAGITDPTITSAIYTLVNSLKGYGIWTKMKALYPFVGGAATPHSYNLINTAQYQLTFAGSPTHNSDGVAWNGVSQYALTGLIPSSVLTLDSTHLSYYSRSNTANNGVEIGCRNADNINYLDMAVYYTPLSQAITEQYYGGSSAGELLANTVNSQGYFVASRESSANLFISKTGSSVGSISTTGGVLPGTEIYIGAYNAGGAQSNYSTRAVALASIGDGLSTTDAANLYTAVQAFQTTLSRQV